MSSNLSHDTLLAYAERHRLRKRLMKWRFFTIAVIVLSITYIATTKLQNTKPYIARIEITDIILENRERSQILRDLASDPNVKAVILELNSPGGTTYGGEQLYKDLAFIKKEKPVATVMGTLATSAAYMAAMGTDYIVAGETTLTGSVGVIMQSAEITQLLDKIGIRPTVIKSGENKAVPNPFEPFTESGEAFARESILETFNWFIGLVKNTRDLPSDIVSTISDGRVITGRKALDFGMIDTIGSEPEARQWLANEHDISNLTDVYTVWPLPETPGFMDIILNEMSGKSQYVEALMLDGLVALWHPVTR